MLSFPIIKHLDVLEAHRLHFIMRGVAEAMHPFVFETIEPTLCRRLRQDNYQSVRTGRLR